MGIERFGGLRAAIADLAAELMLDEEIKQYFTAKRLAAKRLCGGGRLRDLPSNGEIKEALLLRVIDREGEGRTRRLFLMRIVALEAMEALSPFCPRLIGSVATGHVRQGSDIDLHVFAEDEGEVILHVEKLGWAHEILRASVMKRGVPMEFTHVLVEDVFPLELTIYAPRELRHRPKSSTDGKPIVRLGVGALRALALAEHPREWARYIDEGTVPSLEEILSTDADEPENEPDEHDEEHEAGRSPDGAERSEEPHGGPEEAPLCEREGGGGRKAR